MPVTSFKAYKKPIPLTYRIATVSEVIKTLEGDVTAEQGDAILTGTKGEMWPIPIDKFTETYDYKDGVCFKKYIVVEVMRMDQPFEVAVSCSNTVIRGKAGDFKVKYGTNDYGVVDADIFRENYALVGPFSNVYK